MQNLDWHKNWENTETKQGPVGESGGQGIRNYGKNERMEEGMNGFLNERINE